MIYSSGKHEKLTADPQPYVDQWDIDRSPDGDPAGFDFDVWFSYSPRPEFDRPLANPANPVLVEFRAEAGQHYPFRDDLAWWVLCLNADPSTFRTDGYGWSEEHIDHARRVLKRLARLTANE